MVTATHEETEKLKEDIKLKISTKRESKRQLGSLRTLSAKSTKAIHEAKYPCAKCGAMPSRPVSPSGIWVCNTHYFERVEKQFTHPLDRLFLTQNDLNVYATAVEILGKFGASIPDSVLRANPDREYSRGARVVTAEYGCIWYGDAETAQIMTLGSRLGVRVAID